MSHNIGLQVLRAKIRGFHSAGVSLSSRISKSKKARKQRLWQAKRELGTHCRHHLVAYGLLRGVPYDRIEKCSKNNPLNTSNLLKIMVDHATMKQKQALDLHMVEGLLDIEGHTMAQEKVA
jgi:hypothetical protein